MSLRKITLTSLAIAVTALMTACGSSKSDGGQTTLPLVGNAGKQALPTTDNTIINSDGLKKSITEEVRR